LDIGLEALSVRNVLIGGFPSPNFHERESVAERQVLLNPINVGWVKHLGVAQASPAFWILALEQMTSAGTSSSNFASAGDLEAFAHRLPGLNSFGTSH
jgi:hypothetical protein